MKWSEVHQRALMCRTVVFVFRLVQMLMLLIASYMICCVKVLLYVLGAFVHSAVHRCCVECVCVYA